MKIFSTVIIASSIIYGGNTVASAIEYHAERTKPFPSVYPSMEEVGNHIPDRAEFMEYEKRIRNYVSEARGNQESPNPRYFPILQKNQNPVLQGYLKESLQKLRILSSSR